MFKFYTFLRHDSPSLTHEWSKNVSKDYSALLNLKIMDNITRGMISTSRSHFLRPQMLPRRCVVIRKSCRLFLSIFHPLSLTRHRVCCYVRHLTWFSSLAFDIHPLSLSSCLNFNLSSLNSLSTCEFSSSKSLPLFCSAWLEWTSSGFGARENSCTR